ncbi:MAG: NYN domain-containing protein [Phycisphaerales bacterium]|nr:NYN domain-containing protein [Phycisphaerales bacterium]
MVIIDAYNVLNVQGVLPTHLAAPDLVQLVDLVRMSRYAARQPVLVCDGHLSAVLRPRLAARAAGKATQVRLNDIRIVFSGPGEEADDVIERLLVHHSGSASLLLVSSDRRLQRAARRSGGRYVESAAFLGDLAADASAPRAPGRPEFARRTPLSRGETAHWMRLFGLGEPDFDRQPEPLPVPPVAASEPPSRPPRASPPPPKIDQTLCHLIEKSGLEIDLAELDMQRWVQGVEPFRPWSEELSS